MGGTNRGIKKRKLGDRERRSIKEDKMRGVRYEEIQEESKPKKHRREV